jgi:DUF4097 and DUF4098 domain-containing protein YvlB
MRQEFDTTTPPRLAVRIPAGRIDVVTGESRRTVVEVEALRGSDDDVRVEQRGDEIVVETRKKLGFFRNEEYAVQIQAPHGAQLEADTASADLRARGRVAGLGAKTASGGIEAEHVAGEARVRSASGDVVVGSVDGRADVNTASGDVELGRVGGEVSVRTASGDVRVAEAADRVSIYTASGDQEIGSAAKGSVDLRSASGDVRVGIRRGSRVHVDARSMSGETTSELELDGVEPAGDGPLVELRAVTMSGDIRIARAQTS